MACHKITQSAIKKFLSCRKAYRHRYIDELVKDGLPSLNLAFGTFIHECLELWFNGESKEALMARVAETSAFTMYKTKGDEARVKALAMMTTYCDLYPRDKDPFNVVGTEIEFSTPLYNPDTETESEDIIFAGKVDGLVERNGKYWILEHKTSGYVSDTYIKKVWYDAQIQLYAYYFGKANDIEIEGAVYDVLGKSQLKHKKDESLEGLLARVLKQYDEKTLFIREFIPIEPEIIHKRLQDTWVQGQDMLLVAEEERAAYRNTGNCYQWNRPCEYLPICQARNPDAVSYMYKNVRAHRELGGDSATKIEDAWSIKEF